MSIIAQQLRCSSPLLLSMRHQRRWWCWREKKGVRIWVEVRLHAASSEAGVSRVSFILSRRPDGVRHENEPHITTPCRHSHTFPLSPIPPSLSTVQTRGAASVKQRPPPCHRLRRLSSPSAQGGCDVLLTQRGRLGISTAGGDVSMITGVYAKYSHVDRRLETMLGRYRDMRQE